MRTDSFGRSVRVLCVDDHHLVRDAIAALINQQPDMQVVGTAATGEESIALFEEQCPDVTLMDLQLPGMSGLHAIRAIRRKRADARIIVLTMHQGEEDIHRAIEEGAATYLLKDTLSDELVTVIRQVYAGHTDLPPNIQARLTERAGHTALTPR
jgi:DNA-binding NarL/FixJ family response regulator